MPNVLQILRSAIMRKRPAAGALKPGELYINMADRMLGYGASNGNPVDVIAIPFYSPETTYSPGDLVRNGGDIARCVTAVAAPEAFDPAKWTLITHALSSLDGHYVPVTGAIMQGPLQLAAQAASGQGAPALEDAIRLDFADGRYVHLDGGTLKGPLSYDKDPAGPDELARAAYVDAGDRWVKIDSQPMPTNSHFIDVRWTPGAYRVVTVDLVGGRISADPAGDLMLQVYRDGNLLSGATDYRYVGLVGAGTTAGVKGAAGPGWLLLASGIDKDTLTQAHIRLLQSDDTSRQIGMLSQGSGWAAGSGAHYYSAYGGELMAAGNGLLSGVRLACSTAVSWAQGRIIVTGLKS